MPLFRYRSVQGRKVVGEKGTPVANGENGEADIIQLFAKSRDEVRIKSFQGRHLSTKDLTCTESDSELTRDGQETQTLDVELGRKHHVHQLYFRNI